MVTLFGLTMAWWVIAVAIVAVLWMGLGVPFAWASVSRKRKAYKDEVSKEKDGFIFRQINYGFGIFLSLAFSPVALVFWLGKRSGKKTAG